MAKKILISVIVFCVTVIAAGLVMELVKTDKQVHARYFRTRNVFQYQPGNVSYDAVLGYITTPRLDVSFSNEEFATTVRTNALGFRDDYTSAQDPAAIFLGDSYAWGWGVDEQYNVEKQYEKLSGTKVLNAAVPGYGNVQELLLLYKLERVVPLQNKQIFLFFCANDFADNQNTSFNAFPYFVEQNGQANFSRPSQQGYNEWLAATDKWTVHSGFAKKSILWYYLCAATKNMQVKDIYKDYLGTEDKVNGIKAFLLVVENLAALQQESQARVTIVYIPPASYYQNNVADKSLVIVKDASEKLHLQFLDLSPVLNKDDYYPLDLHWKASGHQKAAAFIATKQH